MKFKTQILLTAILLISSVSQAQVLIDPSDEVAGNNGFLIGGFLSNRGLGGGLEFLLKDHDTHQWVVGLRAMGIQNLRESKVAPSAQVCPPAGSKYVFGKANRLLIVSPYIGWQKKIRKATAGNALSMSLLGQIGPNIGLLRPYLIDVFTITSPNICKLNPTQFNPNLHRYSDIVGASSGIGNSWTSIAIKPGLGAGIAIRLDLNAEANYGSSIEFGIRADYTFDKVSIMAEGKGENLFISTQIGFLFGTVN